MASSLPLPGIGEGRDEGLEKIANLRGVLLFLVLSLDPAGRGPFLSAIISPQTHRTTASMSDILLTTLNARYFHASLGLRYLLANLGELAERARLMEYIVDSRSADIVEGLLRHEPRIVGLGVYIWNVELATQVVAMLKQVRPELVVVLGGPEVSYEQEAQEICALADYVIAGPGELAFAGLCRRVLAGERPAQRLIAAPTPRLADLVMPYQHYTDEDIAQRFLYVEASRGCPYKCEFCLSALDKTAWPFELERFLEEMAALYRRGARHFKFVDRTFNLKIDTSVRILEFFLERLDEKLFLHFELIPDHLPERLKAVITRFPPGSLQFEVGIQTFNPEVQARISRRQDDAKAESNLRWLRNETHAHLHTDLIAGLPGENLASFGAGFDRLIALDPHEIQVGILKRLRGAPVIRHTEAHLMRYNPYPPYNVLASDRLDFITLQRINRFARYWDMIGNSGRFRVSRSLILGEAPYLRFMALSDWLYAETGKTHRIALDRLFELVFRGMATQLDVTHEAAVAALGEDYAACGGRAELSFLPSTGRSRQVVATRAVGLQRQRRHLG